MWLRRPVHPGCIVPRPYCVPALRARSWYFLNGLLAVPQTGYLERGTLFFAAESALPILLGRRETGAGQNGVSRVAGAVSA